MGLSLLPNFLKEGGGGGGGGGRPTKEVEGGGGGGGGGLDRISILRGGCWEREGDFFQGRGATFS